MHRTRVILDDWLHATLRGRARREGTSVSAIVRGILAAAGLLRIEGIVDGPRDLGRRHDFHLYGPEPR